MVHPSKYDHIVKTAYDIFKVNGFHATSIDEVITRAKVSKRTMYNHFSSKTPLVAAALDFYQDKYEEKVNTLIEANKSAKPIEVLLLIFKLFTHSSDNKLGQGCFAVHANAEYANKDDAIVKACLAFKKWQYQVIEAHVKKAELAPVEQIALDLFVIIEGITVISERQAGQKDLCKLFNKVINANICH